MSLHPRNKDEKFSQIYKSYSAHPFRNTKENEMMDLQ